LKQSLWRIERADQKYSLAPNWMIRVAYPPLTPPAIVPKVLELRALTTVEAVVVVLEEIEEVKTKLKVARLFELEALLTAPATSRRVLGAQSGSL
jgi:hypothetical protein